MSEALSRTIEAIRAEDRLFVFAQRQRIRNDNSLMSFFARLRGYHSGLPEADRAHLFKEAAAEGDRSITEGAVGKPGAGRRGRCQFCGISAVVEARKVLPQANGKTRRITADRWLLRRRPGAFFIRRGYHYRRGRRTDRLRERHLFS